MGGPPEDPSRMSICREFVVARTRLALFAAAAAVLAVDVAGCTDSSGGVVTDAGAEAASPTDAAHPPDGASSGEDATVDGAADAGADVASTSDGALDAPTDAAPGAADGSADGGTAGVIVYADSKGTWRVAATPGATPSLLNAAVGTSHLFFSPSRHRV